MSIGAVGGSRTQVSYESLEDISIGNPMARLARVLMESKDRQEEAEDLAFDGAKTRIEKATAEEVGCLHDAADATFTAGIVSAAMTVGSGALSVAAASQRFEGAQIQATSTPETADLVNLQIASVEKGAKQLEVVGATLGNAAGPVGKMLDKRTMDFQADAAGARGAAAMARTDMDRADAERKRAINGHDDAQSTLRASIKQNHDARMDSIQMIRG